MYRLVGSILMVLAILAGYAIANSGGDNAPESNAVPAAPAGAEPTKNFNL